LVLGAIVAIVGLPALMSAATPLWGRAEWAIPGFGLLIYALAAGHGPIVRLLQTGIVVFLGEASYALYMTHGVVSMATDRFMTPAALARVPPALGPVLVVGHLLLLLATASVIYLVVERPSRRYLRQLIERVSPLSPATPRPQAKSIPASELLPSVDAGVHSE
jgi:peptidoglycan/LPS O-acetylase OafA/YrhL